MKQARRSIQQNKGPVGEILQVIIGMGVSLMLVALVIGFSFYFRDGYTQMATVKTGFLQVVLISGDALLGVLAIVYLIRKACAGALRMQCSVTDVCLLAYLIINAISFYVSGAGMEGIRGTNGWYVGFSTQALLIVFYFLCSRFYDDDLPLTEMIVAATTVVYGWGLLNRFSIEPIEMTYGSPEFISSMGNINWLCGYYAVLFPIVPGAYLLARTKRARILYGGASVITLAFGLVEGSESAYVAMAAVLLFLLWQVRGREEQLLRYMELILILCGSAQVMRIIRLLLPEALNISSRMVDLMLGNLTLIVGICVAIVYAVWKSKALSQQLRGKIADRMSCLVVIAALLVLAGYLVLLIVNTRMGGALSTSGALFFDGAWGNSRGTTWMIGLAAYVTLPIVNKWIGIGPDLFAEYIDLIPRLTEMKEAAFGPNRLTNAHNEFLTLLVTVGKLGLAAWLGALLTSMVRSVREAGSDLQGAVYAACIIGYMSNNFFSFQQIENLPFIYLILALAEYRLRCAAKK